MNTLDQTIDEWRKDLAHNKLKDRNKKPYISVEEAQDFIDQMGLGHTEAKNMVILLERYRNKLYSQNVHVPIVDALIDYYSDDKQELWHLANRLDMDLRKINLGSMSYFRQEKHPWFIDHAQPDEGGNDAD